MTRIILRCSKNQNVASAVCIFFKRLVLNNIENASLKYLITGIERFICQVTAYCKSSDNYKNNNPLNNPAEATFWFFVTPLTPAFASHGLVDTFKGFIQITLCNWGDPYSAYRGVFSRTHWPRGSKSISRLLAELRSRLRSGPTRNKAIK